MDVRHFDDRDRPSTLHTLVALILTIVLASLTPLARVSPPDPTWVDGFWDNGDFDDVVLLICGIAADLPSTPAAPSATNELVAVLDPTEPAKPPPPAIDSSPSRAPPLI